MTTTNGAIAVADHETPAVPLADSDAKHFVERSAARIARIDAMLFLADEQISDAERRCAAIGERDNA